MKLNDILQEKYFTNDQSPEDGKRAERYPGDSDLPMAPPKVVPVPTSLQTIFSQLGINFAQAGSVRAYNKRQAAQLIAAIKEIQQIATSTTRRGSPAVPTQSRNVAQVEYVTYVLPDGEVVVSNTGVQNTPVINWGRPKKSTINSLTSQMS